MANKLGSLAKAREICVLSYLSSNSMTTEDQIQSDCFNQNRNADYRQPLHDLRKMGYVTFANGNQGKQTRYCLTDEGHKFVEEKIDATACPS